MAASVVTPCVVQIVHPAGRSSSSRPVEGRGGTEGTGRRGRQIINHPPLGSSSSGSELFLLEGRVYGVSDGLSWPRTACGLPCRRDNKIMLSIERTMPTASGGMHDTSSAAWHANGHVEDRRPNEGRGSNGS
ncbi:hypothetical protein BO71DRAFT_67233 [Aspergillus ellipticus CBS 707.79]|uniref:Uncharacterized protein n=1 Tax=Aspergillus ellipticus CBS 707.79 TaxID=1448320 RepID=A0A319CZU8_9EURO|nr:hypothetical protein BO71DRAFT_67233 [Aspergillus ellipticus CBS 707.79]